MYVHRSIQVLSLLVALVLAVQLIDQSSAQLIELRRSFTDTRLTVPEATGFQINGGIKPEGGTNTGEMVEDASEPSEPMQTDGGKDGDNSQNDGKKVLFVMKSWNYSHSFELGSGSWWI